MLGYPWSSLAWFLSAPDHRPRWMRVDRLLGEHGIVADTAAGREAFERRLAARRRQETTLTMGWIAKRLQMGSRKSVVTRLQKVTRQSRE